MPKVSVVIPSYQHAHFIKDTIESVLAQTFCDYEVIVVDDYSTDDTLQVLSRFGDQIRVVRHESNRGLSATRNTGILLSKGCYVAFLDSDDVWMPQKLEKQIPLFEVDPQIGLVFSDLSYFNESGDLPGTAFENAPAQIGMVHSTLFIRDFIPTPTVIVRRSCFNVIGLFDESLTSCEDHDMWLRISEKYAVDFVNKPLARYRFSERQLHKNVHLLLTNMLRIQEKAYQNCKDVRDLPKTVLDMSFFALYLQCARSYINEGYGAQARRLLQEYVRHRGFTLKCLAIWILSYLENLRSGANSIGF